MRNTSRLAVMSAAIVFVTSALYADPLNCSLTDYKAVPGLGAAVVGDILELTWDGGKNQEVRLRLTNNGGTPTIRELSVRRRGAEWVSMANNMTHAYGV